MSIDLPERFEAACIEDINEALLDAKVLAGRVALLSSEGADNFTIYSEISGQATSIADQFRHYEDDVVFTFTGEGFMPVYDYENEIAKTAYAHTVRAKGRYSEITLLDPSDIVCISADAHDDVEDDISYDLLVEDDDIGDKLTLESLRTPGNSPRLFLDLLVKRQFGDEQCVGGIAVRSNDTAFHNVMDLLSLDIDYMEIKPSGDVIPEEDIPYKIMDEARRIRSAARNTGFRRMSAKHQMKHLERMLGNLNSEIGLNRVDMFVDSRKILFPSIEGKDRVLKGADIDSSEFRLYVSPLRVDSVKTYDLQEGKRIRNDDTMFDEYAGLCLVGTIDEHYRRKLGIDTDVLWIPLENLDPDDITVMPKDLL